MLTLLVIASSTQQAVAGEGPYAERLKDEALAVKILNQIGYDTMFGEQVEKHVFSAIRRQLDTIGDNFSVPSMKEWPAVRRNGTIVLPNGNLSNP